MTVTPRASWVLDNSIQSRAEADDTINNTNFTPNLTLLNTISDTIASSQRASWEQGTAAAAFLDLWEAQWSIFTAQNGQGPPYRPGHTTRDALTPFKTINYGLRSIAAQDSIGRLASRVTGDESTTAGSSLDSASSGESVLIGAFVSGDIQSDNSVRASGTWIAAATRQLNLILNNVPRAYNGAISHRLVDVQIWSDGVYMGPPFFAQYGLMTRNQTLLQLAYDQCRLYRDILRITTGTSTNLWAHIWAATANGTAASATSFRWIDSNSWVTGNGWASAGMLRVAASIAQSPFASSMAGQVDDLTRWTREILDAAFPLVDSRSGLFHNYANDTTEFLDSAGSALLAYSAFRLASMSPASTTEGNWIAPAERIYQAVQDGLTPLGDLTNGLDVVNVLSFNSDSTHSSSESLSFLLLLSAARRDYAAGNVTGLRGPGTSTSGTHGTLAALGSAGSGAGGSTGGAVGSGSNGGGGGGVPAGAVAGGVLGGLVFGILATLLALWCLRRRKSRQNDEHYLRHGVGIGHNATALTRDEGKTSPSPPTATTTNHHRGISAGSVGDDTMTVYGDVDEGKKGSDDGDEKYSWRTPDLRRGVSFKEGTRTNPAATARRMHSRAASIAGGHNGRRPGTGSSAASSSGGGGIWSRSGTLKRWGSERRRDAADALEAQDRARFDEDEMTVHDHSTMMMGHGRSRSDSPTKKGGLVTDEVDATAVPMVVLANAGARGANSTGGQGAPTLDRAPSSSGSGSDAGHRAGSGRSRPGPGSRSHSQSRSQSQSRPGSTNGHHHRVPVPQAAHPTSTNAGSRTVDPLGASAAATGLGLGLGLGAAAPGGGAGGGGGMWTPSTASGNPTPLTAPQTPAADVLSASARSSYDRGTAITQPRAPHDYFATPGAAVLNREPSDGGSNAGTPAAGGVSSAPPPRPVRHSRKPSSRAKALRSNRAQIMDGDQQQQQDDNADEAGAGAGGGGGGRQQQHTRSESVTGDILAHVERAMRAEEGAALRGSRVAHGRTGSTTTPGHSRGPLLNNAGSSSGGGSQGRTQGGGSRSEEARALRTYLASAEEEAAAARQRGRSAHSSQESFVQRANSSAGRDGAAAASTTTTRSSIRRVPAAPSSSTTQQQQNIGGGGGFHSVRDVIAAGPQYPSNGNGTESLGGYGVADRGGRTASTRRVSSGNNGGPDSNNISAAARSYY